MNSFEFNMPTITIRIDENLFEKLDHGRGELSKVEFCRKILSNYLNSPLSSNNDTSEFTKRIFELDNELMKLNAEITHRDHVDIMRKEIIQDLQTQLGWIQNEYQKLQVEVNRINERLLLMAAPIENEKKWFEFWK
jgi:chromosome segregation ATPase